MSKPPTQSAYNLYPFYKSPDGEDCLEKIYYYTKYSTVAGAVFSVYEMILNSKPMTVRSGIARFGRFTLPSAAMGLAFGSTLCILGQLRKKSDVPNHLIAGAAAGAVWGVKYNKVSVGHTLAVILGLSAAYVKYMTGTGYPILQMRTPEMRDNILNLDFSVKTYDDPGRPNEA